MPDWFPSARNPAPLSPAGSSRSHAAARRAGAGLAVTAALLLAACGQTESEAGGAEGRETAAQPADATAAAPVAAPAAAPAEPGAAQSMTADKGQDTEGADDPRIALMVGRWAPSQEACFSGEAALYEANGSYSTEGEGGRWRIEGDRLIWFDLQDAGMGMEPSEDPGPRQNTAELLELTATTLTLRDSGGQLSTQVRCAG
jgi:hypothetical protein